VEQERISMTQLLFLMIAMLVSAGHFLFVRIVLVEAGSDGWISIVPAIAVGFAALYAVIQLSKRNAGLSLIQLTIREYGRWLGHLVALPYLLLFAVVPSQIIRAVGDFLPSTMPYTPYLLVTSVLVVLSAVVVRQGIEVIGRCAQLLLPILIVIGILASVLTIKDKHPEYVLPVLQHGVIGILRGAATLAGLFSEVVVAGMILQATRSRHNPTKSAFWLFVLIGMMFIGPLTGPTMMFGSDLAEKFTYPTYQEIRYIQIADFLERIDVLGIMLWAFGSFLIISLFLYALCVGLAQWFGMKSYRPLVFPVGAGLLIMAANLGSSQAEGWSYLTYAYPLFALSVGTILPWVTLLFDWLKQKLRAQGEESATDSDELRTSRG